MKMICPECGKEYNEKMTCCISCGADLVPFEKETEQTVIEAPKQEDEALPLIPERTEQADDAPYEAAEESAGFVRKHQSSSDEVTVPLKVRNSGAALSGAAKFTGSLITVTLMFLLILASVGAVMLRLVTDERNIAEFADRLDIMALPLEQEGVTVQDTIYTMSQGTGLSRDDIRTIYEESTMKAFLGARLAEYGEFVRSGTVPEKLTPEQIKKVFRENLSVIDNTMGYSLNEHDIELACSEIERAEPLLEMISAENMEKTIGSSTLTALRVYGSVPAVIVTAALAASMFVVLRAINKKSTRVLSWGGGAILSSGAAVLAATFLFSMQFPYSESDRLVRAVVKCTCDVISPDLYSIGGILAAMGVILLIWAESLRKTSKL